MGLAAVTMGVKLTARRPMVPLAKLCNLTQDTFSVEGVKLMEKKMLTVLDYNILFPIPHTFIGFTLMGFEDFPPQLEECGVRWCCRYC